MVKFVSLFSGSAGNCLFVSDGRTRLLIDAGKPARTVEGELKRIGEDPASLDGLLITHEHIDHVKGAGALVRKRGLPVYLSPASAEKTDLLESRSRKVHLFSEKESFCIGDIEITPFPLSHDAAGTVGFSFNFLQEGKRLVIAADTGVVTEELDHFAKGADLVYIESNYDPNMLLCGRYPYFLKRRIAGVRGHLSNADCAALCVAAVKSGVRHLVLGHLSQENNMPELAYMTCKNILREEQILVGTDCTVNIAPRGGAGEAIAL